jgi:hypothetical protein
MPDPDVWEYREPAERDRHPQTEATATRWQGEQYRQSEHLSRLGGPQVDAPRHQPRGPQALGYEQTGQLYAPPPQYAPPKHVSWVSAHKGLTAVLSVCALTVAGAAAFALLPSSPGSPGPSAAAAAGVTASGRAQDQRAGSTGAAQPAAAVTVTGTGATASAAAKVKAAPQAAPTVKAGPSAHPTVSAKPVVTGTHPVGNDTTTTTVSSPPVSPPPTPPPPTCTVTSSIPEVQATLTQAEAGPATESFEIDEYGPAGAAGAVLAQIYIAVPGPLTAGAVVTGDGPTNTSMDSCGVVGVAGNS